MTFVYKVFLRIKYVSVKICEVLLGTNDNVEIYMVRRRKGTNQHLLLYHPDGQAIRVTPPQKGDTYFIPLCHLGEFLI